MSPTTREQDFAAHFVSEFFGAAQVDDQGGNLRDGSVRITGLREDVVRARWVVARDGTVTGAWDPDCSLARYRPGRGDDGPQDARDDVPRAVSQ